jgi:lysophospholipase L1-like esterase
MLSRSKKVIFIILTQVLILGTVALTEFGLRQTESYKQHFAPFISTGPEHSYSLFNPLWPQQFFGVFKPSTGNYPFLTKKPENTYRVFVLGGSTTAGFPYSFHNSFSAYLRQELQLFNPDKTIEVVNLGVTAFNSYALSEIIQELSPHAPDAVFIYAGHNEFFGAYGSASSASTIVNNHEFKKLIIKLKRSSILYFTSKLFTPTDEIPDNKTTMERMVRKQHIIPDGKLSDDTRKNFERNLQNVVKTAAKHEINLYLSTVISNTFTQEPLGDSDLALLQYKKGKSLLNEQKTDSAVTLLVNAKNNDPLPFRAPSFINNTIRQVADDYAVPLLDLNKSTYSNPDFITNAESWFTDHLHFSTKTNKYVAREIAQYFSDNDSSLYYTSTQLTHLNPDPFDSVLAEVSNQILTSSYPFSESGIAQKIRLKLIKNLRSGSTTDRSVAKFIQGKTRPPQLYQDLTDQSLQSESELQLLRGLFYHTPFSEETINKSLTRLSENLTSPNSLYLASDIISINPVPQLFNLIGAHYLSTNQTALAINWLKAANKRFPDNKGILYNLARAFQIAGDTETSKLYYSQFKQL